MVLLHDNFGSAFVGSRAPAPFFLVKMALTELGYFAGVEVAFPVS
jgi:hypothetical protein